MNNLHYFKSFVITGKIASGKSILSNNLSELLNTPTYSFSYYLRIKANKIGLNDNRTNLQNLGLDLIGQLGYEGFVYDFFDTIPKSDTYIIDGVRHLDIYKVIKQISQNSILLFLDIPESIRVERIKKRDNIDKEQIETILNHSVESGIDELKEYADYILNLENFEEQMENIRNKIKTPK